MKSESSKNHKIVLAGGCFDILHKGHLQFLKNAKSQGTSLIILLESDKNVRKLKGEGRPVNNYSIRSQNLFDTGFVNIIMPLPDNVTDQDYASFVKSIQPDIIAVTDDDPQIDNKKRQAESVGGKLLVVVKRIKKYSTTSILNNK